MSVLKKLSRAIALILVMTYALVFSAGDVHAETSFNGVMTSNTTWTKANSPYSFQGPVAVNQGVTLTIEPGVIVNVNNYYLQVNGTLNAVGSSSEKIVFTANSQDPNPWLKKARLDFTGVGSGSILENVEFPDFTSIGALIRVSKSVIPEAEINGNAPTITENSITKLTISNGSPTISNNEINGEFVHTGGDPTIKGNIIHNKPWTRRGSPTIIGNKLFDGIHADSSGGRIIIANNEISSKSNYNAIYVQGRVQVVISNNNIVGNNKGTGIAVSGILSSATITQNQVSNCNTGISVEQTTVEVIKNTLINNNVGLNVVLGPAMAGASGEYARVPHAEVKDNTLTKNTVGLQITPYGDSPVVNNNIYDNSQYDLKLQSPTDYTILSNYWGTTDTASIAQKIFDYKHDFNLGHVTVTSVLNSPVPQYSPNLNAPIPTFAPIVTPTPYQTPQPLTPAPTQNPTATPTQLLPPIEIPGIPFDLNFVEIAILVVLVVVAVLLVILIATLRRKR